MIALPELFHDITSLLLGDHAQVQLSVLCRVVILHLHQHTRLFTGRVELGELPASILKCDSIAFKIIVQRIIRLSSPLAAEAIDDAIDSTCSKVQPNLNTEPPL